MSDEIYLNVAKVLDTLPNGFPATESGVEIKLLKKVFTPEQAALFCDMRLTFETAEDVARRTGRPLEGLEELLISMGEAGQLFALQFGETRYFKMMPWIFGIYEFQLGRIDREFAELMEEYAPTFARQFFEHTPQLMQVLPVEEEIFLQHQALPYEKVSTLIEQGQSFLVNECICKKEQGLLGNPCSRPLEVCLAIAPVPGIFDDSPLGRVITRDEAYELLRQCEEAGLVHLTGNIQNGQIFICNCCGCCCGVLRSIMELGIPASSVVNSHYCAQIDADRCSGCGICADERCQVKAIEEVNGEYRVIPERCIGCGLCISTCPTEAIRFVRKEPDKLTPPPVTEEEWFEERGRRRGVDFTGYK
ncbi:MAG: 4Fe-4S binding protein [Deltaproteobacteria bacterium]|nr:4Fe-4S binding protein [Deltaproteobacteria bacterium]